MTSLRDFFKIRINDFKAVATVMVLNYVIYLVRNLLLRLHVKRPINISSKHGQTSKI